MRYDPDVLALVRARVRLASGEAAAAVEAADGPLPPRLLARRGRGVPAGALAGLDAGLTMVLADPARLDRVVGRTAAIGHAGTLATAIAAADRARLGELVDAETRAFALAHRSLARRPDVPLDELAAALSEAAARARGALRAALPAAAAHLVPEPVAPPEPGDADRLRLALDAEPPS